MLVHRARDRLDAPSLDFFVADARARAAGRRRTAEMHAVDVGFGRQRDDAGLPDRRRPRAPCRAPPPGSRRRTARYGRLPWRELLAPAIELARGGVELTHAAGAPARDPRPDPAPHRRGPARLRPATAAASCAGDALRLPDLADTLELIAEHGAGALYRGELGARDRRRVRDGGGGITREDLAAYRVVWRRPVRARFRGHEFVVEPAAVVGRHPDRVRARAARARSARRPAGQRRGDRGARRGDARADARARRPASRAALHRGGLARRLLDRRGPRRRRSRGSRRRRAGARRGRAAGGTTHVSVVDADGNAASLSSSTGSGSGVIVPGTGIHLNNMLGEYDLVAGGPAPPGRRLTSMMAPSIVARRAQRPRLVVGSAGSVRLRGAIMQIVVNVLEHGLGVARGDRPRRACTSTSRTSTARAASTPASSTASRRRLRRRPLAPAQPVLRRRGRRRGAPGRRARGRRRPAPRRRRRRRRLTAARTSR